MTESHVVVQVYPCRLLYENKLSKGCEVNIMEIFEMGSETQHCSRPNE